MSLKPSFEILPSNNFFYGQLSHDTLNDFLNRLNYHRADNGKNELVLSSHLTRKAQWAAAFASYHLITTQDAHYLNNYSSYDYYDSNLQGLAGGECAYFDGNWVNNQTILNSWINSTPHNAILLTTNYTKIGYGVACMPSPTASGSYPLRAYLQIA